MAYTYNKAGETLEASNTVGSSLTSTPVADYNYAYTITGNVQTDKATLAGMSPSVTLAADYDYNNNMTTLAANIGGGTANFNSSTGAFESFTGGTDDSRIRTRTTPWAT